MKHQKKGGRINLENKMQSQRTWCKKILKNKWNIKKDGTKKKPVLRSEYNKRRKLENPARQREYQKRGTKKSKKDVTRIRISFNKQNKNLIIFALYAIAACINAVLSCLTMKKITFSFQNCPVISFDEKLYIYEQFNKNEIPCQ